MTYGYSSFSQAALFLNNDIFVLIFIGTSGALLYGTDVCISRNLSAPQQLSTIYLVPAYLITIVFIIMVIFHKTRFRTALVHFSIMPAIWATIIWSYSYLVYPSLLMLTCIKFQGEWVFYAQTSIKCFGPGHWPYAMLALAIIIGLVIPFPIVFYRLRKWHYLHSLSMIYLKPLREDRQWWLSLLMLRRVLFILTTTYMYGTLRQLFNITLLQLLLLFHYAMPPFRDNIDNAFEAINYVVLLMLTSLGLLQASQQVVLNIFLNLYLLPTYIAIGISVYKARHSIQTNCHQLRKRIGRRWKRMAPHPCSPVLTVNQLRSDDVTANTDTSINSTRRQDTPRLKALLEKTSKKDDLQFHFRDPLLADTLLDLDSAAD